MDPLQPCLVLQQGDDTLNPRFFSIYEEKEIEGRAIAALTSSKLWVTPQGWILVRDAAAAATFLQNPEDSGDRFHLPHLPEDLPRESTCLLSGKPAAKGATGGCVALLVEPFAAVIWYCHVGDDDDDDEWTRHEYDIGTQICWIAACRGRFYFNGTLSGVGVLEFSPAPTFSFLKLAAAAGEHDDVVFDDAKVFLVESEGELYMVSLVFGFGCDMADCETRVHRMDFSEQPPRWRGADDLGGGGRAFLLAPWYFGASCSAAECGFEEDGVFMFFPGDDGDAFVKISNVRDGDVEFMQLPASHRAMWILPTDP